MSATRWTHPATGVTFVYAGEGAGLDAMEEDDVATDEAMLPPDVNRQLQEVLNAVRPNSDPTYPKTGCSPR